MNSYKRRCCSRKFILFLFIFINYLPVYSVADCTQRSSKNGPGSGTTWNDPSTCADQNTVFLTQFATTNPSSWFRTNSIEDFCILTDIHSATSSPAGPPYPPGIPEQINPPPNAPMCYGMSGSPATSYDLSSPLVHSAGNEPNWFILDHLVRHKAQSFQPYDDLPYVDKKFMDNSVVEIEGSNDTLPMPGAANPYFVEVSGISVKGELLHNFLHFRIFANLSVLLGKDQIERKTVKHRTKELPNFATGKISALLIMVKDQDGWPIGDFSTPVPCKRTCLKYSHDIYYGDRRNALPCSYTPPQASMHPGMFVFDVDPGRYCTTHFPRTGSPFQPATPTAPADADPRSVPERARMEGVREVHATWSFGHNTCNFAKKLFIQTLIFEDVETVYAHKTPPPSPGQPAIPANPNYYLFGWTAQYNVLQTTASSLGAPDYVDLKWLNDLDSRTDEIDCHVPLFDSLNTVKSSFRKLAVPSHEHMELLSSSQNINVQVPSRNGYTSALWAFFKASATRDNGVYFGQHTLSRECRDFPRKSDLPEDEDTKHIPDSLVQLKNFLDVPGVRCPCPALASTLAPENRTADPARLHGRLIHASHMAIAYMFLTPIGCFVARYYKETFVSIFCFQEYWWFMWHVVTLITACLFNIGAITSIARKKQVELKYNENLMIHVIFGAISIFVFYMEIITGFFRVADPKKRMRQIFTHWLIGMTNNACAVLSMFAMAWVNQSGFSCKVAYTLILWVLFVVSCYVIMEINMRKTDRKLKLVPRRTYLPPPVKRLFTKEPPGREFRLLMLVIFIAGLVGIQALVSYHIWNAEGGASCHEEYEEQDRLKKQFDSPDADSDVGGPGGSNAGYSYSSY